MFFYWFWLNLEFFRLIQNFRRFAAIFASKNFRRFAANFQSSGYQQNNDKWWCVWRSKRAQRENFRNLLQSMTVFLILKCSEMLNFRRLPPREKNLQVEDFPEALNLEFFSPGDSQPGVFEKTPGSNLEKKTLVLDLWVSTASTGSLQRCLCLSASRKAF